MNNEIFKRILSSFILVPLAIFFIFKGSYIFIFFMSVFFIIISYEWYMMSKNKIYFLPGIFFLIFSTYTAVIFRGSSNSELVIFLIVIIACVASDIGGYIFGKIFKGPKLTKISPNKTFAGMFGSFFLSIVSVIFFLNYSDFLDFSKISISSKKIIIFAFIISLVNQLGDLVVSYFKRISKIKNTGNILPGHGGLLDRVDGMIFAIPFSYFLSIIIL